MDDTFDACDTQKANNSKEGDKACNSRAWAGSYIKAGVGANNWRTTQ